MNVELTSCDDQTIRERVQAAGVVGAGGAGFPTHIKLQARVDTFLVNAAECEPMLKVDQQLMVQQASRLLRGVHYAMKATGASSGIIALKEKYQRAINALTPPSLRKKKKSGIRQSGWKNWLPCPMPPANAHRHWSLKASPLSCSVRRAKFPLPAYR